MNCQWQRRRTILTVSSGYERRRYGLTITNVTTLMLKGTIATTAIDPKCCRKGATESSRAEGSMDNEVLNVQVVWGGSLSVT